MTCFRSSDRPSAEASILTVTSAAVRASRSYWGEKKNKKKQNNQQSPEAEHHFLVCQTGSSLFRRLSRWSTLAGGSELPDFWVVFFQLMADDWKTAV